jgi:predicted nicotinamide N-methyase
MAAVDEASLALVPFSLASPFADTLRLPQRIISLHGHTFVVKQDWKPDGRGGSSIGFGASVYPAAIVLADLVLSLGKHTSLTDTGVLELGCGVGLSSLAASAAGAGCVLATDGDDDVVSLAQENIDRYAESLGRDRKLRLQAARLLWGDEADTRSCTELLGGKVDLLIGADIAACPYAGALTDLAASIRELLWQPAAGTEPAVKAGAGVVATATRLMGAKAADTTAHGAACLVLAYKRRVGEVEAAFFDQLQSLGLAVAAEASSDEIHPDFRQADGQSAVSGERVRVLVIADQRSIPA